MISLMLKTGGKFSYRFTVMISSKGKLTEFYHTLFYSFPSALQGDKCCMRPSLFDNELFIVVWKMSFKYMNYICPEAVNEILKLATCHRPLGVRKTSVFRAVSESEEKADYSLQRCRTATRSLRRMQNNDLK